MADQLHEALEQRRQVMRMRDVVAFTRCSRQSIWRWAKAGRFPSPVQLGARAVGWRRDEVEAWLASRPATMAGNAAGQP